MMILPAAYLPSIEYCARWAQGPCVVDGGEHFVKRSERNRTHILTAGGVLTLTVQAVRANRPRTPMRDVRIDYSKRWLYSEAEVADWASCGNDLSRIKDMIKTHYFIVATNQQSQIVGFSSITHQGYLHSMFVHKDFQGKGIATILLNEIERYATTRGIMRITSEVSLTARPFFEKRGYIVEVEQKRKANQLYLTNFWMEKKLAE